VFQLFNDISHQCSRLTTERYSTSFSSAIKLLHADIRGPIYDLYGFVRFADEIVDTFHDFDKENLLAEFKIDTYKAISSGISLNPILHSFQITVNKFGIDTALIESFFNSMEMDLGNKQYDSAGYEKYIYGSAEVVGLMCLYVFCNGDKEMYEKLRPGAQSLGAAFQKVNFLRDLKADHEELNRTYFPGVNFRNFTEDDKRKIEEEIDEDLRKAYNSILMLPAKSRFGVYLAYKYYLTLFKKIKRAQPQTLLQERVRISNSFKAVIFVKAGLRSSFNVL
jgi:15-cis-phytoene synthase